MRLRVGVAFCLFLAFLGAGCRKGLEPNVDNNQAPETWITAAPMDTITTRDEFGRPVAPDEGRVPSRYHIYWAGSDHDGAVVGYYWAVTETVTTAPPGFPIPELPGPKARDYHFTKRSDSIFVFSVAVNANEREHAFFVYSVDDKGKVDPTPAKLTFIAYDFYPPEPVIDLSRATGWIFEPLPGGGVTRVQRTYDIHGKFIRGAAPVDIVPSGAVLDFAWHSIKPLPTSDCVGYRYQLDEPAFVEVAPEVTSKTYNTGVGNDVIPPGVKKFTLQAMAQSGAHGDSTRYFQMNFEPDAWYSGPDTNSTFWTTVTDGNQNHYWYRDVTNGTNLTWAGFAASGGLASTLLSSDSANVLPADRPERRTFFEIYGHRLYAHAEGDTVNLNSWVIIPSGGIDRDSPYNVKVGVDPQTPPGIVTTPGVANGSPIGFRQLIMTRKPDGSVQAPTESGVYPVFDFNSAYKLEVISGYAPMWTTGKAYAYATAQDGDGTVDRTIERLGGSLTIIDTYDRDYQSNPGIGPVTPAIAAARRKLLVFHVNHKPVLKTWDPQFSPNPNGSSSYLRGASVSFNLFGDDQDPLDFALDQPPTGGPRNPTPLLIYTVTLTGTNTNGTDTTYVLASALQNSGTLPVTIPNDLAPGVAHVHVTLCDFRPSDAAVGDFGRCADTLDIPITIRTTEPSIPSLGSTDSTHRPGSTEAAGRRQQP